MALFKQWVVTIVGPRVIPLATLTVLLFSAPLFSAPLFSAPSVGLGGTFRWDAGSERLTVDIEQWEISRVLEELASTGRWQIFVEPGIKESISVSFGRLPPHEALNRLLGTLNYVVFSSPASSPRRRLYVYQTTRQAATERVPQQTKSEDSSEPEGQHIPNELIVTLESSSKKSIEALAKSLGAKIVGRIDDLNAYRLAFPDEATAEAARDRLDQNEDIKEVSENVRFDKPPRPRFVTQGTRPNFDLKPSGDDDDQLVIGLVDTPVQLRGNPASDFFLPSISVGDQSGSRGTGSSKADFPTHGTSMADTILQALNLSQSSGGETPVRILPVDVYGNRDQTTLFEVAKGMHAASKEGADIINFSLGGQRGNPLMRRLVQEANDNGIMVVGAAGNRPTKSTTYPAGYPSVLAVTAEDRQGEIARYANRGSFVDVKAPGQSLVHHQDKTYLVSGTSPAAAYVSGLAAGLAVSKKKSLKTVEKQLRERLGVRRSKTP